MLGREQSLEENVTTLSPLQCHLLQLHTNLPPSPILSRQKAIPSLYCKFILYIPDRRPFFFKLSPELLAWVKSPYSMISKNPKLQLALFTIWNCDSMSFPNYSTVHCTRQGLSWLPLSAWSCACQRGGTLELFVE